MGRKETVEKAIFGSNPSYLPMLYFNGDRSDSDIFLFDVVKHFEGEGADRSEWGFRWERKDGTMGQPLGAVIKDPADIAGFPTPDPDAPGRFEGFEEQKKNYGDRFYLASLVLSGFSVMSALRGFATSLEDMLTDPEAFEKLGDLVFGFEEEIIRRLKGRGFDGVAFYDDWGTQENLLISPAMWRRWFRPRYERQFALAHEMGLKVYFHSCGYIHAIIPDLIEIGVDMLNISQPNLYDIEALGREFGGKVCFVCPVSYQTTGVSGTPEEIFAEAKRLVDNLSGCGGRFIAYVEEYESIGMSRENYNACVQAFRTLGNR